MHLEAIYAASVGTAPGITTWILKVQANSLYSMLKK